MSIDVYIEPYETAKNTSDNNEGLEHAMGEMARMPARHSTYQYEHSIYFRNNFNIYSN